MDQNNLQIQKHSFIFIVGYRPYFLGLMIKLVSFMAMVWVEIGAACQANHDRSGFCAALPRSLLDDIVNMLWHPTQPVYPAHRLPLYAVS